MAAASPYSRKIVTVVGFGTKRALPLQSFGAHHITIAAIAHQSSVQPARHSPCSSSSSCRRSSPAASAAPSCCARGSSRYCRNKSPSSMPCCSSGSGLLKQRPPWPPGAMAAYRRLRTKGTVWCKGRREKGAQSGAEHTQDLLAATGNKQPTTAGNQVPCPGAMAVHSSVPHVHARQLWQPPSHTTRTGRPQGSAPPPAAAAAPAPAAAHAARPEQPAPLSVQPRGAPAAPPAAARQQRWTAALPGGLCGPLVQPHACAGAAWLWLGRPNGSYPCSRKQGQQQWGFVVLLSGRVAAAPAAAAAGQGATTARACHHACLRFRVDQPRCAPGDQPLALPALGVAGQVAQQAQRAAKVTRRQVQRRPAGQLIGHGSETGRQGRYHGSSHNPHSLASP